MADIPRKNKTDNYRGGSDKKSNSSSGGWILIFIPIIFIIGFVNNLIEEQRIKAKREDLYEKIDKFRSLKSGVAILGEKWAVYNIFGWGSRKETEFTNKYENMDSDNLTKVDMIHLCHYYSLITAADESKLQSKNLKFSNLRISKSDQTLYEKRFNKCFNDFDLSDQDLNMSNLDKDYNMKITSKLYTIAKTP